MEATLLAPITHSNKTYTWYYYSISSIPDRQPAAGISGCPALPALSSGNHITISAICHIKWWRTIKLSMLLRRVAGEYFEFHRQSVWGLPNIPDILSVCKNHLACLLIVSRAYLQWIIPFMINIPSELNAHIQEVLFTVLPAHRLAPLEGEVVGSKEADRLRLQDNAFALGAFLMVASHVKRTRNTRKMTE